MATQAEVLDVERAFFNALTGGGIEDLEKLLADDFSLADLGGGLMSKAGLMQAVGSGQLRFEAIQPLESAVRFYGSTAIVIGRTEMRGQFGEIRFTAHSRYTHVYVEQEGKLRLAAAQGTAIPAG